ncbi:MAG: GTPase Era, partial [Anaerolineales bacterium]|nr:GTPase Era [Anaerolineales bacterium]
QVIFMDTPGFHLPQQKLGEYMVEIVARTLSGADLVLFVVDGSRPPTNEDQLLAERIRQSAGSVPVIIAINKVDLIELDDLQERREAFNALIPSADWIFVSARQGDNVEKLLAMIVKALPTGPRYYPADQITDTRVRDLAGEIIREQALNLLQKEVPHGIAVKVHEFKERSPDLVYIKATIYVERESHKGIVIGEKGRMLKRIGKAARTEMERILEIKVYLDLWVKVRLRWRNKAEELRRLGYVHQKD